MISSLRKRGFTTREAMTYLGVRRRFFERHIQPLVADKAVQAGTAIIYERQDLDNAWERYKLSHGNGRAELEGKQTWPVQDKVASSRKLTVVGKSTASTENDEFTDVVSRITGKPKTS